jgi:tryptophan 7-halogenase
LQKLLSLWAYHVPWHADFSQRDEVFSSASYQYVLYGMGFATTPRRGARHAAGVEKARQFFSENKRQADKLVRNLPLNRDLLAHISEHGLPRA